MAEGVGQIMSLLREFGIDRKTLVTGPDDFARLPPNVTNGRADLLVGTGRA